MRALGRHDTGDAGDAEHVAFLRIALADNGERLVLHDHFAFGDGNALGDGLVRHVDHAGLAAAAQMAKFLCAPGHGDYRAGASAGLRESNSRVAAATSFWRIRLSPTR